VIVTFFFGTWDNCLKFNSELFNAADLDVADSQRLILSDVGIAFWFSGYYRLEFNVGLSNQFLMSSRVACRFSPDH